MSVPVVRPVVGRINGERITVLGWGRAILLQVAHPLVGAGVAAHSGFRDSPLGPVRRLQATVGAMLALTFGDDAEADRATRRILATHDRVSGRLEADTGPFPAGTPYSAHDPDLLLWVHATLLDSMLLLYERTVAPLTPADRDEYVAAAADGMQRVGVPMARAPRTASDLRAYLDGIVARGTLALTPATRAVADAVLSPQFGWIVAPLTHTQRLLTIGLLPPSVRELYGYPWDARRERRLHTVLAVLRRVRQHSPERVARWAASR